MANQLPANYSQLLHELKTDIRQARQRATISANAELLRLYWQIGKGILIQQEQAKWGAKVIDRLAHDLNKRVSGYAGLITPKFEVYAAIRSRLSQP